MAAPSNNVPLTPGIRDPLDAKLWLVCPWPVGSGFCDVVRHFLRTYVGSLQGEHNTARQFVYWEAYQEALKDASTDELTGPGAWHWHDEVVRCVDDCVAVFREKARAVGLNTTTNEQQVSAAPTSPNTCSTGPLNGFRGRERRLSER